MVEHVSVTLKIFKGSYLKSNLFRYLGELLLQFSSDFHEFGINRKRIKLSIHSTEQNFKFWIIFSES